MRESETSTSGEELKYKKALAAIIRRLIATVKNEDGQQTQVHRQQAVELLGMIAADVGDFLGAESEVIWAAEDEDRWVRFIAIQSLIPLAAGSAKAREALIKTMLEGSRPDRSDALTALVPLAHDLPDVQGGLLAYVKKYPGEDDERVVNALTLKAAKDGEVFDFMLEIVKERGSGQVLAIMALGVVLDGTSEKQKGEIIASTLLKCLWSPLGEVCRAARETLSPLKEKDARVKAVLEAMPAQ